METINTATKFKGSYAKFTNADGVSVKCWINGFRPLVTFKDGTNGAAYKITAGHYAGQRGATNCWTFNAQPILVKAERVTKDWKEYEPR